MLENMLLLNWWVATGTLLLEIALVGKLISLLIITFTKGEFKKNFIDLVYTTKQNIFHKFGIDVLSDKFLIIFIFLLSFSSSIMTLVYSEIFLQEPCSLCWFQRIFMYGILILSALPLLTSPYKGEEQNKTQIRNIFVFSVFGLVFALYQHLEQILALYGTHLPCPTTSIDCSKMTIYEYSHITFPWMAVVLFAFFMVIILLQTKLQKEIA